MSPSKLPTILPPTDSGVSVVIDKLLPPKVRYWIYVVFAVALIALSVLGKITQTDADKWLSLAGELLGISGLGLAVANRPRDINEVTVIATATKEEGNAGTDR